MSRVSKTSLIGGRVLLRPLTGEDFAVWGDVRRANRDWLERWEPRPDPGAPDPALSLEAFRARCGAWDRQRQFDAAYGYGIFLDDGARFVGEVSLGAVQRGPFQTASVGYWIDEGAAGRGYVPEAVAVMFRYAFEDLGLHRLEIAIVPRNAPSRRVVEKLGLREEGIARGFLQIAGVYEDHVRFAITADEWRSRRKELEALAETR